MYTETEEVQKRLEEAGLPGSAGEIVGRSFRFQYYGNNHYRYILYGKISKVELCVSPKGILDCVTLHFSEGFKVGNEEAHITYLFYQFGKSIAVRAGWNGTYEHSVTAHNGNFTLL